MYETFFSFSVYAQKWQKRNTESAVITLPRQCIGTLQRNASSSRQINAAREENTNHVIEDDGICLLSVHKKNIEASSTDVRVKEKDAE